MSDEKTPIIGHGRGAPGAFPSVDLSAAPLALCRKRVLRLEAGIERFLEAEAAGEMGNRDKAIEHLQKLMEER